MEFGSNLVEDQFAAGLIQIPYTILVAGRSEAGRRPVAELLARANSLLASDLSATRTE